MPKPNHPEIIEYKCPCCGGIVEFDAGSQLMKCPFCDTTFDPVALQEKDDVLNAEQSDGMQWQAQAEAWTDKDSEELDLYSCKSCGGEIIAGKTTGATHCPFCGNPVVLVSRFSGGLKPDCVIPFQLTKEDAKQKLREFMKGKRLLPRLFSKENHIDEVKGVYVPFWLFQADADTEANFHATRTRMWRVGNVEHTETSHYRLERRGTFHFENVPVDGSSQMEDTLMESLEPFDVSQAKDFQTAYLSGYYADKYDVTAEETVERANERIKKTAMETIRGTVSGYGSVSTESTSIQLENQKNRYALYPIWLLNTTYHGKSYHFAMNGQTGKMVGNMPTGRKEYWLWYLLYASVSSGIAWLILYLLYVR